MTKINAAAPADRSDDGRRRRRGRVLARTAGLVPLAAIAVLTLAACNNSDASSAGGQTTAAAITEGSAAAQNGASGSGTNGGQSTGGQRRPGVSGLIAEVDTNSMQVQASDSQTTVNWTSKTTFAHTVKGALSDVTVGSCLVAVAPRSDTGTSGSAAAHRRADHAGLGRTDAEQRTGHGRHGGDHRSGRRRVHRGLRRRLRRRRADIAVRPAIAERIGTHR